MIRFSNVAAGPETQEDMARDILDQVREVLPPQSIESLTLTARLDELGLDSLGLMAVINRIEEHFGMRFPEEWLYDIETCQDVVACILAKQTQSKPDFTSGLRPSQGPPACKVEVASNGKIPPAAYDVSQFPECVAFEERLKLGVAAGLQNPFFRINQQVQTPDATIDGRPVVRYTSYDYLGLASHPEVTAAAEAATRRFGTSASASRLVGGEHALLAELDQALARFLGTEAAIVFPSGYGTNASLFAHLFGPEDVILYDELAHNSIAQGVQLSQAKHRTFGHNDYAALDRLLHDVRGQYRRAVVAVEGVYSMDGDYPDLPQFLEVKMRHKALLYVDEAHSLGTMGRTGRGVCEHFGVDPAEGDLWMGTISKSLASFGGYLAGRASLIRYLKYTTPGLVFSAASPPANAAAALAALWILEREPQRVARLQRNAAHFLNLAKEHGLDTGSSLETPVIPIILGDSARCIRVSTALLERGIDARPILYPAVRETAARLRFFITAAHTPEQIEQTVALLAECITAAATT